MYEAGTDCSVALELRNPGADGDYCVTAYLNTIGNNWARGGSETFDLHGNLARDCNLQPKENLQFRFYFRVIVLFPWPCFDNMKLTKVKVYFGKRFFQWDGANWFTRNTDWKNFTNNGELSEK